jgi:hypothetical protein
MWKRVWKEILKMRDVNDLDSMDFGGLYGTRY